MWLPPQLQLWNSDRATQTSEHSEYRFKNICALLTFSTEPFYAEFKSKGSCFICTGLVWGWGGQTRIHILYLNYSPNNIQINEFQMTKQVLKMSLLHCIRKKLTTIMNEIANVVHNLRLLNTYQRQLWPHQSMHLEHSPPPSSVQQPTHNINLRFSFTSLEHLLVHTHTHTHINLVWLTKSLHLYRSHPPLGPCLTCSIFLNFSCTFSKYLFVNM